MFVAARRRVSVVPLVAFLALVACGSPEPAPSDAAPTQDSGIDAAVVGGAGTCASPFDLDHEGTALAVGVGRRFVTSNAAGLSELASPSCLAPGSPPAIHQLIFAYTMQTDGLLVASTDDLATDWALDTVVWVLDGCATGAAELACNDDRPFFQFSTSSRAITGAPLAAGTRVIVVVGARHTAGSSTTDAGAFALVLTEMAPRAAGASCDLDQPVCVAGHDCIVDAERGAHCLARGGLHGLCRLSAPACDPGLDCTVAAPVDGNEGFCAPSGSGACSEGGISCAAGTSCRYADDPALGHCITDGAEQGACRSSGALCDTGLACAPAVPGVAPATCQRPLAIGDACSVQHALCTDSRCVEDSDTAPYRHCRADGNAYGLCRLAAPYCDAGLSCSVAMPNAIATGSCQVPVSVGAPCSVWHSLCEAPASCTFTYTDPFTRELAGGTCLARGARGAPCRPSAPECDPTLTCIASACH